MDFLERAENAHHRACEEAETFHAEAEKRADAEVGCATSQYFPWRPHRIEEALGADKYYDALTSTERAAVAQYWWQAAYNAALREIEYYGV
jgi:hypothetical protein